MNPNIKKILAAVEEFERTPEGLAVAMRMSLAAIIYREIDKRGWTQKQLAERVGMKDSQLSRILHGNANVQVDTAAKLLSALGVTDARFDTDFAELHQEVPVTIHTMASVPFAREGKTNEKEIIKGRKARNPVSGNIFKIAATSVAVRSSFASA